jgi:HEAT repeat protein
VLIETALACAPEHPVHAALSIAAPVRIDAIVARLVVASDHDAPALTAALARMHDATATRALFTALGAPSPAARRAAASTLVAIDAQGATLAVRRAASDDPDPEVRRVCTAAVAR